MENKLKFLAKSITDTFMRKEGEDSLVDVTKDVLSDEELGNVEIEHLAQMVNKELQIRLYAEKGPTGPVNFDLLSPEKLASLCNEEFPERTVEKVASFPAPSLARQFADGEKNDLGDKIFEGQFLLETERKLRIAEEEQQEKMASVDLSIEALFTEAKGIIKQALLSDEITPQEVIDYVGHSDESLLKLAYGMTAGCLEEMYMQEKLPECMIVNKEPITTDKFEGGRHLVKSLNTLVQQHSVKEQMQEGYMQIREAVRYAIDGIQAHMGRKIDTAPVD